jgi:post-segregation antitoxin (ccd killing protein)
VIDPATVLAAYKAATTAIELAKKGVALYKEIKSTGGDVKDVLLDLKSQFSKIITPTPEQKKQYSEEVKRVQEIATKRPDDVLNDVWDNLGVFVDQYDLLCKAYIESEVSAHAVYKGDKSLARRVLERLKLRYQLDTMLAEVREQMVYHTPKELGDLWTRFEAMWMQMVAEQDEALAKEMRKAQVAKWQREKEIADLKAKAVWIGAVVFVAIWYAGLMIALRMTQTYRSSYSSPWWSCVLC